VGRAMRRYQDFTGQCIKESSPDRISALLSPCNGTNDKEKKGINVTLHYLRILLHKHFIINCSIHASTFGVLAAIWVSFPYFICGMSIRGIYRPTNRFHQ
jgi:hypothetical protein